MCSLWKDHYQKQPASDQKELDDVVTSTELVLDSHGQLIEMNRVPGENEVCNLELAVYSSHLSNTAKTLLRDVLAVKPELASLKCKASSCVPL